MLLDRIKNSATYYHNTFLYRRDAYNWNQQILNGNQLKKNAGTVLCDFMNYRAISNCSIERQAQKIRDNYDKRN